MAAGGGAISMMSGEKSRAHRRARETWQTDISAFSQQWEECSEELRRLYSDLHQIVTMSLIFQGVIFTAVAQSSSTNLSCSMAWSPVTLAVSVAVAACFAVIDKLFSIGDVEQDQLHVDQNVKALLKALHKLDSLGDSFDLAMDGPVNPFRPHPSPGSRKVCSWLGFILLLLLLCFSTFVAVFSRIALCH